MESKLSRSQTAGSSGDEADAPADQSKAFKPLVDLRHRAEEVAADSGIAPTVRGGG
jgi:hypothetical protein